jgi:hypothetical protein
MGLRASLREVSRIARGELAGPLRGDRISKRARPRPSYDRSLALVFIVMVVLLCAALLLPGGKGDIGGNSSSPAAVIGLHPR